MLPDKGSYDKKIFRLWTILNRLDTRKMVSTRELSEEFNVSYRTVQRDLQLLGLAGFPVVTFEKGQHTFSDGFSLKRIEMSGEEASLLSFLYEIASSLGENFEESFRGILKKVLAKECDSPFYVKIPEGVKLDKKIPFVKDLEKAIESSNVIEMDYVKPEGEKRLRIHPLKIMFFDGFWYLLARIEGKDWIVKLRLENIRNLKVMEDTFDEPENLKTMLEESVNIWFSENRNKKVVLHIDKDVVRYFKQREYFPLQKIKKENKDGSLVVESMVSDYMEVIPNIMRWIPNVKVISPGELKETVKKRIEQYLGEGK
ncbi:MAG: transcriptional regulator [Candidatus Omnitrophota bacterium]